MSRLSRDTRLKFVHSYACMTCNMTTQSNMYDTRIALEKNYWMELALAISTHFSKAKSQESRCKPVVVPGDVARNADGLI